MLDDAFMGLPHEVTSQRPFVEILGIHITISPSIQAIYGGQRMAGSATHWYVIAGADRSPGTWLVARTPELIDCTGATTSRSDDNGAQPQLAI